MSYKEVGVVSIILGALVAIGGLFLYFLRTCKDSIIFYGTTYCKYPYQAPATTVMASGVILIVFGIILLAMLIGRPLPVPRKLRPWEPEGVPVENCPRCSAAVLYQTDNFCRFCGTRLR